jgi:hypothetical protein
MSTLKAAVCITNKSNLVLFSLQSNNSHGQHTAVTVLRCISEANEESIFLPRTDYVCNMLLVNRSFYRNIKCNPSRMALNKRLAFNHSSSSFLGTIGLNCETVPEW